MVDDKLDTITYAEDKSNGSLVVLSGTNEALVDALIFPLNQGKDNTYYDHISIP